MRLHILHHAAEEPIFGLGMAEELARHGYRISPGTLYPLLHGLEKKGYLRASQESNGRSRRTVYRATPLGKKAPEAAKSKVRQAYLRITAPFDGVITERLIHPGALVGPGADSPLLVVQQVSHLRLVVPVPEEDAGAIMRGASVSFRVPAYRSETIQAP
jgi:DNA-binding PadR family transcriptional regulator